MTKTWNEAKSKNLNFESSKFLQQGLGTDIFENDSSTYLILY